MAYSCWHELDGEGDAPEKRSDRTKSTILRAARERLAAQGYDRTTIRASPRTRASIRRW